MKAYRGVVEVLGKGYLLGGCRRHLSSPFACETDARNWLRQCVRTNRESGRRCHGYLLSCESENPIPPSRNFGDKLLGTNSKLSKGGLSYRVTGLSIAPHRRGPMNVCPEAGFCSAVCNLWFAGRTVTSSVREAMIRKATWLCEDREGFELQLHKELELFAKCSYDRHNATPLVRLNVASDLDWRHVIDRHPNIVFYDYTKVASRLEWHEPQNYYLTYSWSERSDWNTVAGWLQGGGNVAVCFDTEYNPQARRKGQLPETWNGYPVIDGDEHDYRLPAIDGQGVIVGLRFKGSRRLLQESIDRGFTQRGDLIHA